MRISKGSGKCSCRTCRSQHAECPIPSMRPIPRVQTAGKITVTMSKLAAAPQQQGSRQTDSYNVGFCAALCWNNRERDTRLRVRRILVHSVTVSPKRRWMIGPGRRSGEATFRLEVCELCATPETINLSPVTHEGGAGHADCSKHNHRQQDHNTGVTPRDHNRHLRWECPLTAIYDFQMCPVQRNNASSLKNLCSSGPDHCGKAEQVRALMSATLPPRIGRPDRHVTSPFSRRTCKGAEEQLVQSRDAGACWPTCTSENLRLCS